MEAEEVRINTPHSEDPNLICMEERCGLIQRTDRI